MLRIGSKPIDCIRISIIIDAMLNFDGDFDFDANADVTCEQGLTHGPAHSEFGYNVFIFVEKTVMIQSNLTYLSAMSTVNCVVRF